MTNPLEQKRKRTKQTKKGTRRGAEESTSIMKVVAEKFELPEMPGHLLSWDTEDDRREKVKALIALGHSQANIASSLNISRKTVSEDYKIINARERRRISEPDNAGELAVSLGRLEQIYLLTSTEFQGSPRGSGSRGSFLKLMLDVEQKRNSLLMETGIITKHTPGKELHKLLGFDPRNLTAEALKDRAGPIFIEILRRLSDMHEVTLDEMLTLIQQKMAAKDELEPEEENVQERSESREPAART